MAPPQPQTGEAPDSELAQLRIRIEEMHATLSRLVEAQHDAVAPPATPGSGSTAPPG